MSNLDTETQAPAEAPVPLNETPVDGPGSGRSEIRKQLEKSVDEARKTERPRDDRNTHSEIDHKKSHAKESVND